MITKEQFNTWVEKLRSNEYEQGKNVLRTRDNKYCCLGVLADVVEVVWWLPSGEDDVYRGSRYEVRGGCATSLPDSILPDEVQGAYIKLNDSGRTFAEIADALEADERFKDLK